jgi:hypothetical protein
MHQPPRQRSPIPAIFVLMLLHTALVLGGVYLMLGVFGNELDSELDSQVTRVERDLERDLERIRSDVRRELRRSVPPVPTP